MDPIPISACFYRKAAVAQSRQDMINGIQTVSSDGGRKSNQTTWHSVQMKNDIEESKNLSYVLNRHLPQNLLILFDMEDGNSEVDGSIV